METDKRSLETIWNRRIEPLLIFSNGYPNIQCRKEPVSYRFNDLLSYCRISLSIYRMSKSHIQIIISTGICCISEIQIDEATSIHRTIILLLIRASCIITTSPIGTPCPIISMPLATACMKSDYTINALLFLCTVKQQNEYGQLKT